MAIRLSSNRGVAGRDISIEPYVPLSAVESHALVQDCGQIRDGIRTDKTVAKQLLKWAEQELKRQSDEETDAENPNLTPVEKRRLRRFRSLRRAA